MGVGPRPRPTRVRGDVVTWCALDATTRRCLLLREEVSPFKLAAVLVCMGGVGLAAT